MYTRVVYESSSDEDVVPTVIPLAAIPNQNVPLAEIPDEAVPLAMIIDEEVPLAGLPKTGDTSQASGLLALISGMLLALVALDGKRRKENQM
jgi:LPXTG-motif cell wall-anchored protein